MCVCTEIISQLFCVIVSSDSFFATWHVCQNCRMDAMTRRPGRFWLASAHMTRNLPPRHHAMPPRNENMQPFLQSSA